MCNKLCDVVKLSCIYAFLWCEGLHFSEKAVSLHRVFHSIRFKVNKVGIQWYPIFFALLSTPKHSPRKTLTSTKQTIYLWRNSHTPPPNHPKEERERNTRCANMQRRSEAKHCSSLCSQSEGDEYCGGQTRRVFKIQKIKVDKEAPAPLKGRVFKIKKSLCAVLSQITWQLRRCP